jgi:hypothetical protein
LILEEENIIWPNRLHRKPDGIRTRRNVSVRLRIIFFYLETYERFIQVVTIAETPFISIRSDNRCDPATEILCPRKKLNGI